MWEGLTRRRERKGNYGWDAIYERKIKNKEYCNKTKIPT